MPRSDPVRAKDGERILSMRIVVTSPPSGCWLAVQEGKEALLPARGVDAGGLVFEFPLRVAKAPEGTLNFLGPFAQGTPADRFVYVNSGTTTRQPGDEWFRRAKLKLALIPPDLLEHALANDGACLEARFHGTAKDGRAVCASLPAATVHWRVVDR